MPEHDTPPAQVTGRFASPESARAAIVRLEQAGFDASAIHLDGVPDAVTRTDQSSADDLEATGDVARGAVVGGAIGGIAGAAAGVVAGLVTGDAGTGAMIGTAAAVGGSTVGGLAGTYAGLPVTEDAWVTYELDPNDPHPVTVVVRVDSPEQAGAARDALRG